MLGLLSQIYGFQSHPTLITLKMTTRKLSVSLFLELASYFLLLAFLNFGATDGGTTNNTSGGDETYRRGGGGGGADVAPAPAEAPSSRNCKGTRTGTADALNTSSNNSAGNIGQGINNNILPVSVNPCSRSIVVGTPTPTPATAPAPVRPLLPLKPTPSKRKTKPIIIYVVVAVLIVAAVLLCSLAFYLFRRKKSKSYRAVLREYFGSEGTTLQSLQFSLATIEYATNKFSPQNRIGRGGFGEVYKGVLPDGREIAVKRLSRGSGQGAPEFKNEVLLIAKLQHRNLVALLGFCLKEHEKILVYEYVPNKSLDYFLFGPQKERVLVWSERYKIIVGIARGILYLHQHSRLKVIHRDLKPSNILLDDEMNPKISDFGMAKMVAISETEGSTNRIVGTYGYMSPEYAMRGQFSEKSDVFSFGVIILEIVTGKKNASDHQDSEYIDYLLSYAWMQWRDENLLEIIDSNMNELSSNSEVIKCIQIGLLCVQANPDARPTMDTIVRYLNNDSVQLPFPREPAFFLYGQVEPTIGAIELGFGQHADTVNQMSISNSFPR